MGMVSVTRGTHNIIKIEFMKLTATAKELCWADTKTRIHSDLWLCLLGKKIQETI